METLFLDCSLAGVHYSSASRWNILCKMSAYVNEDSALTRVSCFVKSCCNLSFRLVSGFALPPSSSPGSRLASKVIRIILMEEQKWKGKMCTSCLTLIAPLQTPRVARASVDQLIYFFSSWWASLQKKRNLRLNPSDLKSFFVPLSKETPHNQFAVMWLYLYLF